MELIELLNTRGIEYKKTNNPSEILISCTSGLHNDTNPSLSYNLDKNLFHCWSCGFGGGASKFLESIGEVTRLPVDSKQPYRISKLKDKIRHIIEVDDIKLPSERHIFKQQFKGISAKTMMEFNAFTTQHLQLQNYICIPVYQFGKLKFIEGRKYKDNNHQPKYYRRPANAKTNNILFPLDKIKNTNYLIFVEGIFDMLNMWQLGYKNTVCLFGASNFNKTKLELVDRIGVTKVDIMMDPDTAGTIAAEKISNQLDTRNIQSRIIKLPLGRDPGDLNKEEIKEILR